MNRLELVEVNGTKVTVDAQFPLPVGSLIMLDEGIVTARVEITAGNRSIANMYRQYKPKTAVQKIWWVPPSGEPETLVGTDFFVDAPKDLALDLKVAVPVPHNSGHLAWYLFHASDRLVARGTDRFTPGRVYWTLKEKAFPVGQWKLLVKLHSIHGYALLAKKVIYWVLTSPRYRLEYSSAFPLTLKP